MGQAGKPDAKASRLAVLLGFLQDDPDNLHLIGDAANAALDESALDEAVILLDRHRAIAPFPMTLVNVEGLVALRQGRLADAAAAFDRLVSAGVSDPSVRFNRAWVHALAGEYEAALPLLDEEAVAVTPRAAALKVEMLHHLGRIEDALAAGQGMVERFPGNDLLLGSLSVAAMDADDLELARHYSQAAGGGVDALTTRGLLALNDDDAAGSIALFDQALAARPDAPRAWLGKGLGMLVHGDARDAVPALRRGAEIFGDHLGSWIAVGWAQLVSKDVAAARATFEHALSLDENFAETHGGLAVIDIAEGDLEGAKRRANIALRLDRECFGGMLARLLLSEAKGDEKTAQRIWDKAMETQAGAGGKTLARAMIGLGLDPSRVRRGDAA